MAKFKQHPAEESAVSDLVRLTMEGEELKAKLKALESELELCHESVSCHEVALLNARKRLASQEQRNEQEARVLKAKLLNVCELIGNSLTSYL